MEDGQSGRALFAIAVAARGHEILQNIFASNTPRDDVVDNQCFLLRRIKLSAAIHTLVSSDLHERDEVLF